MSWKLHEKLLDSLSQVLPKQQKVFFANISGSQVIPVFIL